MRSNTKVLIQATLLDIPQYDPIADAKRPCSRLTQFGSLTSPTERGADTKSPRPLLGVSDFPQETQRESVVRKPGGNRHWNRPAER